VIVTFYNVVARCVRMVLGVVKEFLSTNLKEIQIDEQDGQDFAFLAAVQVGVRQVCHYERSGVISCMI